MTYCTKCGEKCLEQQLDYIPWFMRIFGATEFLRTGERVYPKRTYCPNGRWYNTHLSILTCKISL